MGTPPLGESGAGPKPCICDGSGWVFTGTGGFGNGYQPCYCNPPEKRGLGSYPQPRDLNDNYGGSA